MEEFVHKGATQAKLYMSEITTCIVLGKQISRLKKSHIFIKLTYDRLTGKSG